MQKPKRRRSDRGSPQAVSGATHNLYGRTAEEWVSECAARIAEIEPHLARKEANEIAHVMLKFERTGVMKPTAAADFVAREMRRQDRARFERRVHRATSDQ